MSVLLRTLHRLNRSIRSNTTESGHTQRRHEANHTFVSLEAAGHSVPALPLELAVALVEQPLLSVGVEHTVFESALPLVLHPLDLVVSA